MGRARTRLSILTATMVSVAALTTVPWSPGSAQTATTEEELLEEGLAPSEDTAATEDAQNGEGDTTESVDEVGEPSGEDEPADEAAGVVPEEDAAVAEEDAAADGDGAGEPVAVEESAAEDETTGAGEAAAATTTQTDTADSEEVPAEQAATEDGDASGTKTSDETVPEAEADVADEEVAEEESQGAAEAEGGEQEAQAAEAPPEPEADVEAAPEVSDKAEEAAAELLADDTPAETLSNKELRARIAAYRALLEEPQLSAETSDSLRARLKTDRDVLRVRVAEAEAADVEAATLAAASSENEEDESFADEAVDSVTGLFKDDDNDDDDDNTQKALIIGGLAAAAIALPLLLLPDEEETVQIVSQPQPQRLEDLTDAELGRRMLALQQASQDDVNYTYAQRQSFADELEISRDELRRRLERDREERELYYLDSEDYDVPINYVMPQQDYQPAIWAAEVDQQQIWQQLLAAPRGSLPEAQYGRKELNRNIEWIVTRPGVRESLPGIELDTITFGFNEDFLREEEIYDLDRIARLIEQVVVARPEEIFLIEGHTDAVGNQEYNWRLSQRRAEAVKDLITRYYLVPPENLVTAGLGEAYLKIWTPQPEEENRRVTLRRITPLLAGYAYR